MKHNLFLNSLLGVVTVGLNAQPIAIYKDFTNSIESIAYLYTGDTVIYRVEHIAGRDDDGSLSGIFPAHRVDHVSETITAVGPAQSITYRTLTPGTKTDYVTVRVDGPRPSWNIQSDSLREGFSGRVETFATFALGFSRYYVWMDMSTPMPYGPSFLQGAPGLVLQATRDDGEHFMTLDKYCPIGCTEAPRRVNLSVPDFGLDTLTYDKYQKEARRSILEWADQAALNIASMGEVEGFTMSGQYVDPFLAKPVDYYVSF